MHISIHINEEEFWLLPERAIFWPSKKTLLLADVHLGKSAHFRKNGIALLSDVAFKDLENLNNLVKKMRPERLLFLGDLFHADHNHEWGLFTDWAQHLPCETILVNGNHDTAILKFGLPKNLQSVDFLLEDNFLFTHHPATETEPRFGFNFYGHIHPGIRLKGKGRQSLQLPCFIVDKKAAVLPAFGATTGTVRQNRKAAQRYFAIAEGEVFEV